MRSVWMRDYSQDRFHNRQLVNSRGRKLIAVPKKVAINFGQNKNKGNHLKDTAKSGPYLVFQIQSLQYNVRVDKEQDRIPSAAIQKA